MILEEILEEPCMLIHLGLKTLIHPNAGVNIQGGARWSFRFLCCITVLSCSVYPVLIVLDYLCLIKACLLHGL